MLRLIPIVLAEANAFIELHHRHNAPMPGAKFCLGVADENDVRGVAIVGRPVARMLDDGLTLELNRVCTDGARNACSMLYAASWRAARALGYIKLITYTLESEGGASLRGAGWKCIGKSTPMSGHGWDRARRPRVDTHPLQQKLKWEAA